MQYGVSATALPTRRVVRRWALATVERDLDVTVRFVGEAEGRRLNAAYRAKPSATNVLTFVYDGTAHLSGDLVLCVPVLRREARLQGKSLIDHCAHLVVHGMLHLQGYDHEHDRDAHRMETRETRILAHLRIADPYAPDAPSTTTSRQRA